MEPIFYQNSGRHSNWISCDGCSKWYHSVCVGMSREVFNYFDNNSRTYICSGCSEDVPDLFNAKNFLKDLGSKMKNMEKEMTWMKDKTETLELKTD